MPAYLLTWSLLLLAGSGCTVAVFGWPRRGAGMLLTIGVGGMAGLLLGGLVAGLVVGGTTGSLAWRSWLVLAAFAAAGWYSAWRSRGPVPLLSVATGRRRGEWLLLAGAVVLIGLRLVPLLDEVLLRPVYPWDAWSVWMVKPKAWFLGGHYERYVDPVQWFAAADGLRTLPGAGYPELSGHLQLLLAVALGDWNEPLLLLPWLVMYMALVLALAGFCRRLDCPAWSTALACYVLASLPLLNAQVALAGYLDLWVAAALMLALATWLLWRRERRLPLLLAALGFAASMALLKREGAVWLALMLGLFVFDRLPARWQRRALWSAAIAAVVLTVAAIGLGGWIDQLLGHLDIPGIRKLDLGWRPGGLVIVRAIFSHDNWHLLGLLLVALPLLRWRQLRIDDEARLLGLFILVAWIALLMLFCLSPAAQWAVRQTATNRLVLQLVPAMILWLMLLVRDLRWPAKTTSG